jgi:hypothetical protein
MALRARRWLAWLTLLVMLPMPLGWLVVAVIGLGAFSKRPEQHGCYLPEELHGTALLLLAVGGIGVAVWGAVRAWRSRDGIGPPRYLWATLLTALLVGAFLVLVVPLNPESEFIDIPCHRL